MPAAALTVFATNHSRQREGSSVYVSFVLELNEDAVLPGLDEVHHERKLAGLKCDPIFECVAVDEGEIAFTQDHCVPVRPKVGFEISDRRSVSTDSEHESRRIARTKDVRSRERHFASTGHRDVG